MVATGTAELTSEPNPGRSRRYLPTARQLKILQLLAEYRFLTTNQLHPKLENRLVQLTHKQLKRLKKEGLVSSFALKPELGSTSQYCWLLKREGARLLEELTGQGVNYNSHYQRQPDWERIKFRDWELELENQIEQAGWQVIKPQVYNQHRPLPPRTPQHVALAEALTVIEQKRRPGEILEPQGPHALIVPLKANDYVATYGGSKGRQKQAVVFILSPLRASNRFWNGRLKQYRLLARELKIVGVFGEEKQALEYQELLEKSKVLVTTLNRVGNGLIALK